MTTDATKSDTEKIISDVLGLSDSSQYAEAKLQVDNRVLARITDGIYRRPSSAFRELIFNAYDADATSVVVNTDSPRFERMSVRDNGRGMDVKALANLVTHIGGSSKRTYRGVDLDTVSAIDPDLSPGGRRLIGKIGIGLFAVAHLTTHFRVITKRKGAGKRLVAEIWLKTWTEERLKQPPTGNPDEDEFVTGEVRFSTEDAADDIESHGTEIVLLDIRPSTRDILRSSKLWHEVLGENPTELDQEANSEPSIPLFHIGYADGDGVDYKQLPNVPWQRGESPARKFALLYDGVARTSETKTKNPDIEEFLDEYFAMIWRLSLAAPIEYLEKHPFSFKDGEGIEFYKIQNKARGQAEALNPAADITVADAAGLSAQISDPCEGFVVVIDDIELRRPAVLPGELLGDRKRMRSVRPMLFVGQVRTSLGNLPADRSGGALEFDAYFYWNSLIVPKQNRGVLIRINGASGVLYDDSFMEYQVSELNRLNQITGEVFIRVGMDPALNIDRESFNVSHPHYQYVSKWVHAALRQITNKLKELSKKGRQDDKQQTRSHVLTSVESKLDEIWSNVGDSLTTRPQVVVSNQANLLADSELRTDGALVYAVPIERLDKAKLQVPASLSPLERCQAIFQVMAAYGLLESLTYPRQQQMFNDILEVLSAEGKA